MSDLLILYNNDDKEFGINISNETCENEREFIVDGKY
jgi:hypothetical protein